MQQKFWSRKQEYPKQSVQSNVSSKNNLYGNLSIEEIMELPIKWREFPFDFGGEGEWTLKMFVEFLTPDGIKTAFAWDNDGVLTPTHPTEIKIFPSDWIPKRWARLVDLTEGGFWSIQISERLIPSA